MSKFPKNKVDLTEDELIGLLIEKDEKAFRTVVEQYEQKVYSTVIGFLRSEENSDDVAQEVFISVYENIQNFRKESSLSTWIYRIAVTKSLEFLRKQKRKKRWGTIYSLWSDEGEPKFEPMSYLHPGIALENQQTAEALFKAIDRLPETQSTAFVLNKIDGFSYEETAEVMKTTVSSVESLLHRATTNLKKYLVNYYKDL